MVSTSARLLRLLSLLQSRREWSGSALANSLEVDARTVRRDVDRLRSLGYQVAASAGSGGGYRLGGGREMPPLLLSDEETVAVALGLITSALGAVAGLEEASLRAFTKLEQIVPSRLKTRLQALEKSTSTLGPAMATPVDANRLAMLAVACRERTELTVDYRDREEAASQRTVEPHKLVCTGRRWYLLCFDLTRDDWRTLRVDRVVRAASTGRRFVEQKLPRRLEEVMSDALSAAPYTYRATIRFYASAAEVEQRSSPSAGRIEVETPKTCLFMSGSMSLDALAIYVAIKGFDFEVLEPPELMAEVENLARRFTRAAGAAAPARKVKRFRR